MAWAPWIFLGLEAWMWRADSRGLFLANAGICLQIPAGHIQYFFYTAIAAGLQSLVLSIAEPTLRCRAIPITSCPPLYSPRGSIGHGLSSLGNDLRSAVVSDLHRYFYRSLDPMDLFIVRDYRSKLNGPFRHTA
jgi:hypothetical protein